MEIEFNFKDFANISIKKNDKIQLVVQNGMFFELKDS